MVRGSQAPPQLQLQLISHICQPTHRYYPFQMINIQIRLSESGVKEVAKVPQKAKIKQIQEIIRRDYKIQIIDQLLMTKNGIILHPNDGLEGLAVEKQKTYVANNQNVNDLKRIQCIVVFSKKSLKSQDSVKSPRDEDLQDELRMKCKQMAGLNLKSQFKPLEETKSKQQLLRLQQLNPNILKDVNKILRSDEKLLSELHQCQQLKSFVTQQSGQVDTQIRCMQSFFRIFRRSGSQILRKCQRLYETIKVFRQRKEQTIRSLQQLKKIPLSMKLHNQRDQRAKNLFDLHFSQQRIKEYASQNEQSIQQFIKKIEQYKRYAEYHLGRGDAYGDGLTEVRNQLYGKAKIKQNDLTLSKIEELAKQITKIKQMRESQNRKIFEFVNRWLSNENDHQAQQYLLQLEDEAQKISVCNNDCIQELENQNEGLRKSYSSSYRHKYKNQVYFKQAYNHYEKTEQYVKIIQNQFKNIDKELSFMLKELQSSWSGKQYRQAYETSKGEVQRRAEYLAKMESLCLQGMKLTDYEEQRRKKYISGKKKSSRVFQYFPEYNLMQYTAAKLVLSDGNDSKLPKLESFSSIRISDPNDKILKQVEELAAGINIYKKSKENQEPNRLQNKLQNLQDILIKTTKICHQIYSNKLNQQVKKYQQAISQLQQLLVQKDMAIKKIKEQNSQLKFGQKSQMESQRELKKNKSDLEDYKRKDEQFRSEPAELARLRDEAAKSNDIIRSMNSQNNQLQQSIKALNNQRANFISQLNNQRIRAKQQISALNLRCQQAERTVKALNKQKKELEESLQILQKQIQTEHTETQNNKDSFYSKRIREMQEEIATLQSKIRQQGQNLSQQRLLAMEYQKQAKNKEEQIIILEKLVDDLRVHVRKSDLHQKSDSEDQTTNDYTLQIQRLREENSRLQQELQQTSYELKLIIQKQTFEVQTQTQKDIVDLEEVQVGRMLMFIPYASGVYIPLVLMQSLRTEYQFSNTYVSSYKSNYFLNMDNFPMKTKDLVNECSLIILAKVENIVEAVAQSDNQLGVKTGETYYTVEVEKPQYIVGFEDEDMSLKNYANV